VNKLLKSLFFLLVISTCISNISLAGKYPPTGISQQNKWISNCQPVLTDASLMYGTHAAPLFRKEFTVDAAKIRKATLYISAAGYYKASLNGKRIGDIYLDPAWTDFSKRIYYTEYDLTSSLNKGNNCLGVTLGNGFYNPLPLQMWGHLNLRNALPTGNPSFTARLVVEYSNGKRVELSTDNTWKYAAGPVLKNSVYLGEWYDARKELPGWDLSGFDDSAWKNACPLDSPGGKLQSRFFPPVKITAQFPCVKISLLSKNTYLADMGTNFAGIYKIRLKGDPGDTITLRFGERIYDDGSLNPMTTVCGQIKSKGSGGPGAPDIAWQTNTYVFGRDGDVWFSPEFTFHTFRYMEIKGLKYQPQLSDIQGLALNTAIEECNWFECSSDLLNSIQKITTRTFQSNLVSVQSDCPAREKFGYGGDINAVSESYIYNFDMHDFYRKTVYDWADALNDSVFIDTAPYIGLKYCGISWESAFLFLQDQLYQYYGDKEIIHEMYDLDLNWMEKVARLHPKLIIDKGLGDHESMIPVPVQVTGTIHYLRAAGVMKRFASLMNDRVNEKKFTELENTLRENIQEAFWNKSGGENEKMNKQTLFASLLYSGVISGNDKPLAVDSLMTSIKKAENGHFTTGIFGTKYILEAMSQNGLTQEAFDIVNSPAFPGWGFMLSRGATTLWETWKESDNTYSNCHPMFGSVSEWFYRWLGGIRPDNLYPGFQKFILDPQTPEGLTYVKTRYKTPSGYIKSAWQKNNSGGISYEITVPKGTTAQFKTAVKKGNEVEIICNSKKVNIKKSDYKGNWLYKDLEAGNYLITKKSF
jgi:alpha-L-rhamnosidase